MGTVILLSNYNHRIYNKFINCYNNHSKNISINNPLLIGRVKLLLIHDVKNFK